MDRAKSSSGKPSAFNLHSILIIPRQSPQRGRRPIRSGSCHVHAFSACLSGGSRRFGNRESFRQRPDPTRRAGAGLGRRCRKAELWLPGIPPDASRLRGSEPSGASAVKVHPRSSDFAPTTDREHTDTRLPDQRWRHRAVHVTWAIDMTRAQLAVAPLNSGRSFAPGRFRPLDPVRLAYYELPTAPNGQGALKCCWTWP